MLTRWLAQVCGEAFYWLRPGTRRAVVGSVYVLFRVLVPASWLTLAVTWWS